jgi:hypothetical protein
MDRAVDKVERTQVEVQMVRKAQAQRDDKFAKEYKKLGAFMNQQEALAPKMQQKICEQEMKTKAELKAIGEQAKGLKENVKKTKRVTA